MTSGTIERIKEFARAELARECGYCGVAISSGAAILTATDNIGNNIKITIEPSDNGGD